MELNQPVEKTTGRLVMSPVVGPVGTEDKMTFCAGEGYVKEAFFLFEITGLLGVVAGKFVLGEAGDDDGVELQALGLMDGEDADEVVFRGEEVEVVGEAGLAGEGGEHFSRWAGRVVVALEEMDETGEVFGALAIVPDSK